MTRWPTVKDVEKQLVAYKRERVYEEALRSEDGLDVRLQVYEDRTWAIRTGDSQYDQDHRGFWGSGTLTHTTNCRELAAHLLNEAKDHEADNA